MTKQITFPPAWLAEARAAYDAYREEWDREEAENAIATGDEPAPAQDWDDFLIEYHYAELESAVFVDYVYCEMACRDR